MNLVPCREPTKIRCHLTVYSRPKTWRPGNVVNSFASYLHIVTFCYFKVTQISHIVVVVVLSWVVTGSNFVRMHVLAYAPCTHGDCRQRTPEERPCPRLRSRWEWVQRTSGTVLLKQRCRFHENINWNTALS
jgi:hypothetical protein